VYKLLTFEFSLVVLSLGMFVFVIMFSVRDGVQRLVLLRIQDGLAVRVSRVVRRKRGTDFVMLLVQLTLRSGARAIRHLYAVFWSWIVVVDHLCLD
jgi:hypothetical protein